MKYSTFILPVNISINIVKLEVYIGSLWVNQNCFFILMRSINIAFLNLLINIRCEINCIMIQLLIILTFYYYLFSFFTHIKWQLYLYHWYKIGWHFSILLYSCGMQIPQKDSYFCNVESNLWPITDTFFYVDFCQIKGNSIKFSL